MNFVKQKISSIKASAAKLPNWVLPLMLVIAAVSIVWVLSKGFGIWVIIVILVWLAGIVKGIPWLVGQSVNAIYGLFVVLMLITLIAVKFSDGESTTSSGSSEGDAEVKTYQIKGDSNLSAGYAKTAINRLGTLNVEWIVVIEDPSIVNNGRCIDASGDWCADDPDGSHAAIAEIKYHYGLTFKNTESSETVAASTLRPVYCNGDLLKANPQNFVGSVAYADKADLICNGTAVASWQPTSLFYATNSTQFESVEAFESSTELGLYDISSTYVVDESSTETSQSVSEGNTLSTNEFSTQPLVKTYSIELN